MTSAGPNRPMNTFIDVIFGDRHVRESLEEGLPVLEIEREWARDLEEFMKVRARYLLYPV
jgi:uncharacterized protein YbbC (DUF1343 family)